MMTMMLICVIFLVLLIKKNCLFNFKKLLNALLIIRNFDSTKSGKSSPKVLHDPSTAIDEIFRLTQMYN